MTLRPRFILGKRGSDFGVFISPPGVDAQTAALDELSLAISGKALQITMRGVSTPTFPKTVVHGLGYKPYIFPNLISTDLVGGFGYVRPFDNSYPPFTLTNITVGTTDFTINQGGTGSALNVYYSLLNKALPA